MKIILTNKPILVALYDKVDDVIAKYTDDEVDNMTCTASLQKMMKPGKYLCVCTIEQCADFCGLHISKRRMGFYRSMHCVSWSDMNEETRVLAMSYILDDFRSILMT